MDLFEEAQTMNVNTSSQRAFSSIFNQDMLLHTISCLYIRLSCLENCGALAVLEGFKKALGMVIGVQPLLHLQWKEKASTDALCKGPRPPGQLSSLQLY